MMSSSLKSLFLSGQTRDLELLSEMTWSSRSKLKSCESTAIVTDYPSFSSCFVNQQARYLDNNLRQQTLIEAQTEAQGTQQVSEQVRKATVRKDLLPFAYIIQGVFLNAPIPPIHSSVPKLEN